jgi:hypothetical protein
MHRNGAAITPWPGSPACSSLFTVSGDTVTAGSGVTIDFAVAHDGVFKISRGDPFEHFSPTCGPPTAVTYSRCQGD